MLYTCTFFLIFFPLIFLGRGFVCLQTKTDALGTDAQRTTSNVKKKQTSEGKRLKTSCELLTRRTRSHRRWIAINTRTSYLRFFFFVTKRKRGRKKHRREAAINTLLPETLELSGRMIGLYNLQSYCEREYVRIE